MPRNLPVKHEKLVGAAVILLAAARQYSTQQNEGVIDGSAKYR
jgi:hypothetical protein